MSGNGPIVNALTCDVEDYFQVSAMAPYVPRQDWDSRNCRVEHNVERILALFSEANARATFFTLGWIAERYPSIVRDIVSAGHELASHGYGHQRAVEQTPAQFLDDIRHAKALLEDIAGVLVKGYRAPSFSIGTENPWASDCIVEAGYLYSSSVYPVRRDLYGDPDAPRFPYSPRPNLTEIPMTTVRLFRRNFPAGGGGFFRLMPYPVSRWCICRVNEADRRPALFYFHPWEIDPGQPRIPGISAKTRIRHYLNLGRTEARLRHLLKDFHWGRVDEVFLAPACIPTGLRR